MLTVASFLVSIAGVAAIIKGNKNEFLSVNTTTTAKGFLALIIVLHHLAVQTNRPASIFYQWGGGLELRYLFSCQDTEYGFQSIEQRAWQLGLLSIYSNYYYLS